MRTIPNFILPKLKHLTCVSFWGTKYLVFCYSNNWKLIQRLYYSFRYSLLLKCYEPRVITKDPGLKIQECISNLVSWIFPVLVYLLGIFKYYFLKFVLNTVNSSQWEFLLILTLGVHTFVMRMKNLSLRETLFCRILAPLASCSEDYKNPDSKSCVLFSQLFMTQDSLPFTIQKISPQR